eukprot:scaffold2808_cov255-Pinguiococcus_pyrenoidosus.AAC.13
MSTSTASSSRMILLYTWSQEQASADEAKRRNPFFGPRYLALRGSPLGVADRVVHSRAPEAQIGQMRNLLEVNERSPRILKNLQQELGGLETPNAVRHTFSWVVSAHTFGGKVSEGRVGSFESIFALKNARRGRHAEVPGMSTSIRGVPAALRLEAQHSCKRRRGHASNGLGRHDALQSACYVASERGERNGTRRS